MILRIYLFEFHENDEEGVTKERQKKTKELLEDVRCGWCER